MQSVLIDYTIFVNNSNKSDFFVAAVFLKRFCAHLFSETKIINWDSIIVGYDIL
jgi:hypothetical protein